MVREAIRSPVSTRVIEVHQGRSSLVNPVSSWSPQTAARRQLHRRRPACRCLLEARRAVEVAIVEPAAQRRTPDPRAARRLLAATAGHPQDSDQDPENHLGSHGAA